MHARNITTMWKLWIFFSDSNKFYLLSFVIISVLLSWINNGCKTHIFGISTCGSWDAPISFLGMHSYLLFLFNILKLHSSHEQGRSEFRYFSFRFSIRAEGLVALPKICIFFLKLMKLILLFPKIRTFIPEIITESLLYVKMSIQIILFHMATKIRPQFCMPFTSFVVFHSWTRATNQSSQLGRKGEKKIASKTAYIYVLTI